MSQRRNLLKIDLGFANILHMLELLPECGKDLHLINLYLNLMLNICKISPRTDNDDWW